MTIDMRQFYQVFYDETDEQLAEEERLLLQLDLNNPDPEDIDAIFRVAHSIKGSAGTFGFNDIAEVTHVMETLLDAIRKTHIPITQEHVAVFLESKDILKMLKDGHQHGTDVDSEAVQALMAKLERLAESVPDETDAPRPAVPVRGVPEIADRIVVYEIELPALPPQQLDALLAELETLGEMERDIAPTGETILRLVSSTSQRDLLSFCSFLVDPEDIRIHEKPLFELFESEDEGVGERLSDDERGYGFFDDFVFRERPETEVKPVEQESLKLEFEQSDSGKAEHTLHRGGSSSIRVGVDKVDQLINLVGELVITQAMIEQQTAQLEDKAHQRLLESIVQLTRNSRELQEAVMSMRMIPMEFVFSRFPRLVHDLAAKLGKKIELITSGSATELDKGVIERIIDPLTHLVRNSVDHGIEKPDVRRKRGKSEVGRIFISASHQGGSIVIEVNDDGGGLDREKILSKAREKGMTVSDEMTDQEVWNLIFMPGFSTADVISDVSGRGVGMDVVRRNIMDMGGLVDIRSARGLGTMLSVYLPLTLAILDGMLARTGDEIYILPLGYVIESLQPLPEDIRIISGKGKVVRVRDEFIALLTMGEIFDIEHRAQSPSDGIVVIVEADGRRAAIMVDELVGQQQVVVKNLETNFKKVPNVSGATILGDGEVALIADISGILRNHSITFDINDGLFS